MSTHRLQDIWKEQCKATLRIRERFGLEPAFDYLVGEKLMNYAEASSELTEFAREYPHFVSEVRSLFTAEEIDEQLARVEREQLKRRLRARGKNLIVLRESTNAIADRKARWARIKELLTVEQLGTS